MQAFEWDIVREIALLDAIRVWPPFGTGSQGGVAEARLPTALLHARTLRALAGARVRAI